MVQSMQDLCGELGQQQLVRPRPHGQFGAQKSSWGCIHVNGYLNNFKNHLPLVFFLQ